MRILRPEEITPENLAKLRDQLNPEELREAYALARAAFTAEDLQRYTELDAGVSADDVLRELDEAEQQEDRRSP